MGGRSGSSGRGGSASRIKEIGGGYIDLGDMRLQYGRREKFNEDIRGKLDKFENEVYTKNREHMLLLDKDGKEISRTVGRTDRVSASSDSDWDSAVEMSHNHPRRPGLLGGSFSAVNEDGSGDLAVFTAHQNLKTMRATAKEGTYSMTKRKNFDGEGLKTAATNAFRDITANAQKEHRALKKMAEKGEITKIQYHEGLNRINNKAFIQKHNWYLANQSKYGYNYKLERRK